MTIPYSVNWSAKRHQIRTRIGSHKCIYLCPSNQISGGHINFHSSKLYNMYNDQILQIKVKTNFMILLHIKARHTCIVVQPKLQARSTRIRIFLKTKIFFSVFKKNRVLESFSPVHTKTLKRWKYDSIPYRACAMLVEFCKILPSFLWYNNLVHKIFVPCTRSSWPDPESQWCSWPSF